MRKIFTLAAVFFALMASTVFAASAEEQRAAIEQLHDKALDRLYLKYPAAERVLRECYSYATLSNSGIKYGIFGSAHGRGVAVNQETGERVYLHMEELSAGIGIGATEYDLVFIIANKDAWDSFIAGKTRFSMGAQASATDGSAGGAIEDATVVARGIWMYQMTKKGVSLEATISGMKIYADKKLNADR